MCFLRAIRLLQVKENEMEHERKIEEAIRKMEKLSSNCRQVSSTNLLLLFVVLD